MCDLEVSIFELKNKCKSAIVYKELTPEIIYIAANNYLNGGCKSRIESRTLVNALISNRHMRETLLKF